MNVWCACASFVLDGSFVCVINEFLYCDIVCCLSHSIWSLTMCTCDQPKYIITDKCRHHLSNTRQCTKNCGCDTRSKQLKSNCFNRILSCRLYSSLIHKFLLSFTNRNDEAERNEWIESRFLHKMIFFLHIVKLCYKNRKRNFFPFSLLLLIDFYPHLWMDESISSWLPSIGTKLLCSLKDFNSPKKGSDEPHEIKIQSTNYQNNRAYWPETRKFLSEIRDRMNKTKKEFCSFNFKIRLNEIAPAPSFNTMRLISFSFASFTRWMHHLSVQTENDKAKKKFIENRLRSNSNLLQNEQNKKPNKENRKKLPKISDKQNSNRIIRILFSIKRV